MSKKLVSARAIMEAATSVDPSAYAWAAGVAINLVAMWGGSLSSDTARAAPANDNERGVLELAAPAQRLMPANDATIAMPPESRTPVATSVTPSPTQAVWRYLCERSDGIGEAVRQTCPEAGIADGETVTFGRLRLDDNATVYEPQMERYVPTEGPARMGLGPFPWDERFGAANDNRHVEAPQGGQDQ